MVATTDQATGSVSVGRGLLKTARPKQWVKNILVLAAAAAGGRLFDPSTLLQVLIAFTVFSLVSSGSYFLNDASDVAADRRHPKKRARPMAAGVFSPTLGRVIGVILVACGLGIAAVAARREFVVVVALYVVNTMAYSLKLKHIPIFDILSIAAGFLLRAIGGAAATGILLSNWFLTVASFGSLFIVVGKRFDEHRTMSTSLDGHVRHVLTVYTESYLRYLRSVSTGAVLVSYCLFAFEKVHTAGGGFPWYQLSILPFVAAILKYSLLVESGQGETPEDVLLGDRGLVFAGVLWAGLFICGVYFSG